MLVSEYQDLKIYCHIAIVAVVTLRLVNSHVHCSALTRQCDYGMLAADQ